MKYLVALLAFVSIAVLSVVVLSADDTLPNDPNLNPDANACFAGGIWEGKCGDSGYLWEGGWYLIRYFTGIIPRSQFPDQYKWALPTLEEEAASSGFGFPTCIATSTSGVTST